MSKRPDAKGMFDDDKFRTRKENKRFQREVPGAALLNDDETLEEKVLRLEQELAQAKEDKLKILRDALLVPTIQPSMKAGCIGEFEIDVTQVCPLCWEHKPDDEDDVCEVCNNESDENGYYTQQVDVPWDTQKKIFKRMCHYKFLAIKNGEE